MHPWYTWIGLIICPVWSVCGLPEEIVDPYILATHYMDSLDSNWNVKVVYFKGTKSYFVA